MTALKQIVVVVGFWIYLPFTVLNTHAQENTIVRDFNNDKTLDFLVSDMEWEGIESWDYVLTDGKTGKRWGYMSSLYYVGPESFVSPAKTRNELSESWEQVIRSIEDTLINYRQKADPSLKWVLGTKVIYPAPDQDSHFDRLVTFNKEWFLGNPFIPENYTYVFGEEASEYFEDTNPFETYYWYYRSHNHKEDPSSPDPEEINVNRNGIKRIKHALREVNDGRFAWVFMSGVAQTGGPSKLRWPSMEKVLTKDGLVFLQQQVIVGEYVFWVGDLEKGLWARINNEDFEDRIDFRLEEGNLIILDREGSTSLIVSIKDIKKEINEVKPELYKL